MSDSISQASFWAAKSGKFALLSRVIKHRDYILKLFLTVLYIFWKFLLFSSNFRHFSQRFRGIESFIYSALACSLAILPQIFTFVTRNFIGSCVIRCAFWLVSRKDDCLERELRESFWIKKLINKISIHLSNKYWEILYKSNRQLFSCVCIAWYKHSRGWENSQQFCNFVSGLHNCLEFSQPLECLYQAMQTRKAFTIA